MSDHIESMVTISSAYYVRMQVALQLFMAAYDRDNPARTADFHPFDCQCLRCARDMVEAALHPAPIQKEEK